MNLPAVSIGPDGLCCCDSATTCPLGKTGSSPRCSEKELEAASVRTRKADPFNETVQTIVFKFKLRQSVNLKAISRPGIVTGCLADTDGLTYRVAYWNNGERKSEWLFAEELEAM